MAFMPHGDLVLAISAHGVHYPFLTLQKLLQKHGRDETFLGLVERGWQLEDALEASGRLVDAAGEPHAQGRRPASRLDHHCERLGQAGHECRGFMPVACDGLPDRVQSSSTERFVHQELVPARTQQPVGALRRQCVQHPLATREPCVAAADDIEHMHALEPVGRPRSLLAKCWLQLRPNIVRLLGGCT